jgi:hypothetical protein
MRSLIALHELGTLNQSRTTDQLQASWHCLWQARADMQHIHIEDIYIEDEGCGLIDGRMLAEVCILKM